MANVVIIGTYSRINYMLLRVSKVLGKKVIYIMHGYIGFESQINNSRNCKRMCKNETSILNAADLILPVSENYKEYFLRLRPEYKNKTHYLMNGIEKRISKNNTGRNSKKIIVCGANRFIKRNLAVCEAVNRLNDKAINRPYVLDIYGTIYDDNEKLIENSKIKIRGKVPYDDLLNRLSESKLFVLNSRVDSFGLSAIDALMCGCDVLISKNAGITSILNLEKNDIIYDCNDIGEIARKIQYNIRHSNNKRIMATIDYKHYSWRNVALRLEKISNCIASGIDIDEIRRIK